MNPELIKRIDLLNSILLKNPIPPFENDQPGNKCIDLLNSILLEKPFFLLRETCLVN
jgi:hypothetical protein